MSSKQYYKNLAKARERRIAIKTMRAEGKSISHIAARYQISRQRVEQILAVEK